MNLFEKIVLFLFIILHAVAVFYYVKQWNVLYLWAPLVVSIPVAGWIGVRLAKRCVKDLPIDENS